MEIWTTFAFQSLNAFKHGEWFCLMTVPYSNGYQYLGSPKAADSPIAAKIPKSAPTIRNDSVITNMLYLPSEACDIAEGQNFLDGFDYVPHLMHLKLRLVT